MRKKDKEIAKEIKAADIVFFTGGDQDRLAEGLVGTESQRTLISEYLNKPNKVIAGTSAGAAIMAKRMISNYGKNAGDPPRRKEGLGLVPDITFETHMLKRQRRPERLLAALEEDRNLAKNHPELHPARIGIGMDEGTAVVIKNGKISVVGEGRAIVAYAIEMRGELKLEPMTDMDLKLLPNCERFADQGLIMCTYGKEDEYSLGQFAPQFTEVRPASFVSPP